MLELKICLQWPEELMDPFSRIYRDILLPAKNFADSEGDGLREAEEKRRGNSNTSVFVQGRGFSVGHS